MPAVALQVTPLLLLSLVTTATKPVMPPTCRDAEGGAMAIAIAGAVMVTMVVADLVGSVTDVAVMVTVPPLGIAPGAV